MTQIINFARYTSIKIGPVVEVKVINDPSEYAGEFIIGRGYNLLVSHTPPSLAILGENYSHISHEGNILRVGAAATSAALFRYLKANNLGGLEFTSKLPGSVGGLIKMNAGLKEFEIFNTLVEVKTVEGVKTKNEIDFGYRNTNLESPILEGVFELVEPFNEQRVEMFRSMRSNQPSQPSAGSCFKNPEGDYAGRLIEEVGLKGLQLGGMAFSDVHANFLVNMGQGSFEDAMILIREAQERVQEKFGIVLELEVQVV